MYTIATLLLMDVQQEHFGFGRTILLLKHVWLDTCYFMEPVFHDLSLSQVYCEKMSVTDYHILFNQYYIFDRYSDSNTPDIITIQDYGSTIPATPFLPGGNRDPGKQMLGA